MLSPHRSIAVDLCQECTLQPLGCQELVVGSPPPSSFSSCLPSHLRDAASTGKPHSSLQGLEMLIFKEPSPCLPQERSNWVKPPRA